MKGLNAFIAILYFCLIAGIPSGSMAAAIPSPPTKLVIGASVPPISPVPITPPGNDGLLSGMTLEKYQIPSGWSLLKAQGFEGACPAGEECGIWGSRVTSTRPHTGSKSIEGDYAGDQSSAGWVLTPGNTGPFTEIYVSFYEYIESQALFNDEMFLLSIMKRGPDGEIQDQHWFIDWFWATDESGNITYNGPKAAMYILGEYSIGTGGGVEYRYSGKLDYVPKGSWVQWEVWYRQNTPGSNNGFCRIYKNGNLFVSAENKNLNNQADMSDSQIMVGGVYTKLVWMTDYPACTQCSNAPGIGTDACTPSKNLWGQSFSNPHCGPSLPSFKRFFDDIIIMKR